MRIISLKIDDIIFEKKDCEASLYESIARRGLAFPIKVSFEDGQYFCVDGHKRLSVLSKLRNIDSNSRFVLKIPVIVVNSDLNRSNDCWRSRNTH